MKDSTGTFIRNHPKLSYYLLLAVGVTIFYFAAQAYLLALGKELVWTTDPKPLYLNFLLWGATAFQEMLDGLASGAGLVIPMYTYSLGYGADSIASMGSYLLDPFNVIVYLFPPEMIGTGYAVMNWARFYCAAVAFSVFCFSRNHGYKATGIASLLYISCGFVLFLGLIRHPKFIDWAILLPLVLRAADLMFERRGRVMFTVVMFFQFSISIFYSYMTCIVLLGYCLVKYFAIPRKRSIADFCKLVLTFAALGILAFLLSAPFSLPQLIALLSQGRATSGSRSIDILFNVLYYLRVPGHLVGDISYPEGMISCCVGLFGTFAYIVGRKHFEAVQWRAWAIGLAISYLGLVIPFFGHLMNGMGYCTDRWMLVFGFVSAYVFCMVLPKLGEFSKDEWKRITICVAVIVGLVVFYAFCITFRADSAEETKSPLIMTALFIVFYVVIRTMFRTEKGDLGKALAFGVSIIFCSAVSVTIYCLPMGSNWANGYSVPGKVYGAISDKNPAVAVEQTGDTGYYRYTEQRVLGMKNSALTHEPTMGIDYYTSYYNQQVADFRTGLGISDHHMAFSFAGSDSRVAIDNITGAKYYVCKENDLWRVPAGYVDTGIEYAEFHVFENKNPVPLAFLAPGIIDEADYDAATMAEREELLLQGAVVDPETVSDGLQKTEINNTSTEVPFKVEGTTDGEYEDGAFRAYKSNATLTISFEETKDAYTYLMFENLAYDGYSPSEMVEIENDTPGIGTRVRDSFWTMANEYPIKASIGKRKGGIDPVTTKHRRYGGKVNWVINMGTGADGRTTMTITFEKRGEHTFDALKVVELPVEPILERSRALQENALDDFEMHRNGMSASVTLDDDNTHLAQFMVAYGKGWSVTVDGEPATAVKVDKGFLGVELNGKGTHEICWSYETPGLRLGAELFLLGLAISILALVVGKRRAKHAAR